MRPRAYEQDSDVRRARETGFDDPLVKPVDPDQRLARIEAAVPS
jgi:DNA-binding response OmpR family regulator